MERQAVAYNCSKDDKVEDDGETRCCLQMYVARILGCQGDVVRSILGCQGNIVRIMGVKGML